MAINSFPNGGSNDPIKFPEQLIDPVSKFRVSNPENLIDTDFEYGLQPTKWETVELINNTPSFFSKSGDTTIDGISSIITNAGTREIIVKTELDHGLAVGIPINVTGTKSITADGSYIINSIPDTKTFTYLCKDDQVETASILDLYSSIITGEFFQGSQLRVSDSEGIVTDAAGTSKLTVTTNSTHGFGENTPFYFLNLNSTVAQEFQAANTASKTFDASNSATAQTFDGSNTLSSFNIDWSNSAVQGGTISNITATNLENSTITVAHTLENFANLKIGTALYYDVSSTGGFFQTNPRGIVFIKTVNTLGTTQSTFQVSLVPNGPELNFNSNISGTFQIANQARTFAGNNVNVDNQTDIQVEIGESFSFDGSNSGSSGEDGPTGSQSNIVTVVSYQTTNDQTNITVSSEEGLDYYVGAMLLYSTTGVAATGLTNNTTYFVKSFGPTANLNEYVMTVSEFPDTAALVISGGTLVQTFKKIGVSIDKDIIHVKNSNFDENAMLEYTYPVSGNFEYEISEQLKNFFFVELKFDQHNYQLSDNLRFQPMTATGGVITDTVEGDLSFRTHAFTTTGSSTFVVEDAGTDGLVEVLVVAGGGGGGGAYGAGGGGGAGGLVYHSSKVLEPGTYSVVVGTGGVGGLKQDGGPDTATSAKQGRPGTNSSFDDIVAIGGGGGNMAFYFGSDASLKNGGSGGGGGDYYTGVQAAPAASLGGLSTQTNSGGGIGYGNAGGSRGPGGPTVNEDGSHAQPHEGAGGGGAGGVPTGGSSGRPSDGGIGRLYPQFAPYGSPAGWFAGGGGGGQHYQAIDPQTNTNVGGFFGGGGLGADERAINNGSGSRGSTEGVANTGGGGGGGARNYTSGAVGPAANGGSGIVLVRYSLTRRDPKFISATGGFVTNVFENGTLYAVHSFTAIGSNTFEITKLGASSANNQLEYLIVGGGGGGGSDMGGGGGGGGVLEGTVPAAQGSYEIIVGNGGLSDGVPYTGANPGGDSGQPSSAFGITALGGGGGAGGHRSDSQPAEAAKVGSSGGGASGRNANFALGTSGQGFQGGTTGGEWFPGAGGGAGSAGVRTIAGDGKAVSILGETYWFGGGGGSSGYTQGSGNGGRGGGGGGAGGSFAGTGNTEGLNPGGNGSGGGNSTIGGSGGANTGGGAGGHAHQGTSSARRGGSGIVVVRYPVFKAPAQYIQASGGSNVRIIEENGILYAAHMFTKPGTSTFTINSLASSSSDNNLEYLIVAGGGGGGMDMGGGGGGGGVISGSLLPTSLGSYPIVIGAGGAGSPAAGTFGQPSAHVYTITGTNGGNSSAFGQTAIGGGRGGHSVYAQSNFRGSGQPGGSGGGATGYDIPNGVGAGAGTPGQGFPGGAASGNYWSGGGGGAGGAGGKGAFNGAPFGGPGIPNSILGTTYHWGGGGGGSGYSGTGGNGGIGGGGGGSVGSTTGGAGLNNGQPGGGGGTNQYANSPGGDGGKNTGGGGGGGGHYNANNKGGDGGSGIVIVRYRIGSA